jgi:hypothetical protein
VDAAGGYEDIRRFNVAVDDASRVGGIEAIGDLYSEIDNLGNFKRLAIDQMPQGVTVEQFHCNQRLTFELVDVVDSADVLMV